MPHYSLIHILDELSDGESGICRLLFYCILTWIRIGARVLNWLIHLNCGLMIIFVLHHHRALEGAFAMSLFLNNSFLLSLAFNIRLSIQAFSGLVTVLIGLFWWFGVGSFLIFFIILVVFFVVILAFNVAGIVGGLGLNTAKVFFVADFVHFFCSAFVNGLLLASHVFPFNQGDGAHLVVVEAWVFSHDAVLHL